MVNRGIDDLTGFSSTRDALNDLAFSVEEQTNLFAVVASLLHLGNVHFEDLADNTACVSKGPPMQALQDASSVLMEPALEELLTHRSMQVRGERMRIDLRADQAELALHGLLKSVYTLAFSWVVKRINQVLVSGLAKSESAAHDSSAVYLEMLDIFGFENFAVNSFEQLCINFANEKLHQLFLHAMFKAEEEIVAQERVSIPPIAYCDNRGCLQLLEHPPHGIFLTLDTCCRVHTTAANFCLQVHEMHSECEFFLMGPNGCNEDNTFTVRHFAGDVEYAVAEFLSKNTESLDAQTRQLLGAPRLSFLLETFNEQHGVDAFEDAHQRAMGKEVPGSSPHESPAYVRPPGSGVDTERIAAQLRSTLSGQKRSSSSAAQVGRVASTTGKKFTQDMGALMDKLQQTTSHFIHCVKPNGMEQPELLSYEMVAEQLSSLGTLEVVQLMGLGFPVRIKYADLRERYLPRLRSLPGIAILSPKLFTEMILEVCEVPPGDYKLGVGRLFLKHRAAEVLDTIVPLDPSLFEPLVRSKVSEFWAAAARIQASLLTHYRQRRYKKFWRGVVTAQKYLRMWLAVRRFRRQQIAAGFIQHVARSRHIYLLYICMQLQKRSAKRLQAYVRMWRQNVSFRGQRRAAVLIQRTFRRLHGPNATIWEKTAIALNTILEKLPWFKQNQVAGGEGAAEATGAGAQGGLLALLDALRGAAPSNQRQLLAQASGSDAFAPGFDEGLDGMAIESSDEVIAAVKAAAGVAAALDAQGGTFAETMGGQEEDDDGEEEGDGAALAGEDAVTGGARWAAAAASAAGGATAGARRARRRRRCRRRCRSGGGDSSTPRAGPTSTTQTRARLSGSPPSSAIRATTTPTSSTTTTR